MSKPTIKAFLLTPNHDKNLYMGQPWEDYGNYINLGFEKESPATEVTWFTERKSFYEPWESQFERYIICDGRYFKAVYRGNPSHSESNEEPMRWQFGPEITDEATINKIHSAVMEWMESDDDEK